jgi:hypothetical protein
LIRRVITYYFLLVFILLFQQINAQTFPSPINAPLIISGSFGEPRENHFHTGIDISTRGKIGYAVSSVDDGYISRIKISAIGYGRVIYITHPQSGLMTVYGHLSKLNDELQSYITEQQYALQKYEVEFFPDKSQFIVKKGDIIGYSGNTGGSTAPHLHFEVRDASGESFPFNPMKYNLEIPDTIKPKITELALYNLDICCGQIDPKEIPIIKTKKGYSIDADTLNDTLTINSKLLGLGIKTFDFTNNGLDNDIGIYSLEMKMDGRKFYYFSLDKLDFAEGRYANCHVDYKQRKKDKEVLYRTYLLGGNKASIYKDLVNRGILSIDDGLVHKIEIISSDYKKNESRLNFYIKYSPPINPIKVNPTGKLLNFDKENILKDDSCKIIFSLNTLYDDTYLKFEKTNSKSSAVLSPSYQIGDAFTPLHKPFEINIKPDVSIKEKNKPKTVIVRRNNSGGLYGYTSKWVDGMLQANPREFGDFCVMIDSVAPVLGARNFTSTKILKSRYLQFSCSDKIMGLDDYDAYLDGKWILMEYDAKNDLSTIYLDKNISKGEHSVKIIVSDSLDNKKTYNFKFKI